MLVRQADGDRATRAAVGDGHLKVVDEAALRARPLGAHGAHVLRVIAAADVANGQLVLADGQEGRWSIVLSSVGSGSEASSSSTMLYHVAVERPAGWCGRVVIRLILVRVVGR